MSPGRRFTIADGMILVAATAVGLGATARCATAWGEGRAPRDYLEILSGSWLLLSWSVAAVILALRGPRSPAHRLARRPGFAASVAALAATGCVGLHHLYLFAPRHGTWMPFTSFLAALPSPPTVAGSVATAWVLLATGRRWRPEPHWLDRLGCVVGLLWFAQAGVVTLYYARG